MSQYHKTNGFTPAEEKELQSLLKVIEAIKAREPKKAKDQCTEDEYNAILNYARNGRKGQKPPKAYLFEPIKVEAITPVNFETLEPRGIVEYRLCDPTWETWHKELIEAQQEYAGLIFAVANQVKTAIDEEPDRNAAEIISDTLEEAISRSKNKPFSPVLQGAATNALTKIRPIIGGLDSNTTVDEVTGTATVKEGDIIVTIDDFLNSEGIRVTTHMLFGLLQQAFTESDETSPTVTISLDEFMQKRGLKNEKEARKQVKADLETLFKSRVTYKEKSTKDNTMGDFIDARICEAKGIRKRIIHFTFSHSFYMYLKIYGKFMYFPNALYKLNSNKYPNSYAMGTKIAELKNMNYGKKSEDIISVKTLLKTAPYIPSYEAVAKSNRNYARIIDRFETDMNALGEENINIGTWEYCKKNGDPLTDEELKNFNYELFSKLNIKFKWNYYPDRTEWLERRAQRIEEAKAKKKAKPQSGNKSRTTHKN